MKRSSLYLATVFLFVGVLVGVFQIINWYEARNAPEPDNSAERLAYVEKVTDEAFGEATRKKFQQAVLDPKASTPRQAGTASTDNPPPVLKAMPDGDPPPYANSVNESQLRLREQTLSEFAVFRDASVRNPMSDENTATQESLIRMSTERIRAWEAQRAEGREDMAN
ncbi:hypothetical protein G0Q06_13040 [Puniceicoccales bacterium CK1056]|uniref:Uncharacterized protein n=1 Tax=Oceanipulchritudo coccoides TaxID=2706888 RepID=A0A6B2M5I3_9BACT|nr:hypothetical protein [Oceanipulchritudo coccoides]NDV63384.1 hypothetical protein [Oceanipulchritudo coccoides]